jgi:exopolyphosphatase/guanosine-5'-triphosphate,3'-diphosphate pyrophosphatase
VTSLGKDLDVSKSFHPDSMQATFEALKDYKEQLEKISYRAEDVLVTATEASRVAQNATAFFARIKKELGFTITTISAEGEAYYTAVGVASAVESDSELVIMDMGGASTELIRIQLHPFQILSTVSMPVGSVRATDWQKKNCFSEKMKEILGQDLTPYFSKSLLCVAGTMTSLSSMFLGLVEFNDKAIDGHEINFSAFKEFCADLQKTNTENLLLLFPYLGKRAPMLSAGALVAELIGEKLQIEKLQISTRGLRYGVVIQGKIDESFITK